MDTATAKANYCRPTDTYRYFSLKSVTTNLAHPSKFVWCFPQMAAAASTSLKKSKQWDKHQTAKFNLTNSVILTSGKRTNDSPSLRYRATWLNGKKIDWKSNMHPNRPQLSWLLKAMIHFVMKKPLETFQKGKCSFPSFIRTWDNHYSIRSHMSNKNWYGLQTSWTVWTNTNFFSFFVQVRPYIVC